MAIEWAEAWRLWFGGQQPPSDAVLWFMSVRWWARAGKIAALLGGMTVILDILGPERLRGIAAKIRALKGDRITDKLATVGILAFFLLWAGAYSYAGADYGKIPDPETLKHIVYTAWAFGAGIGVLLSLAILLVVAFYGLRLLARTLEAPIPANALRLAAVVVVVVGFHFDLLSS